MMEHVRWRGRGPVRDEDISDDRFVRRHHSLAVGEMKRRRWGSHLTRFALEQQLRRERSIQQQGPAVAAPAIAAPVALPPGSSVSSAAVSRAPTPSIVAVGWFSLLFFGLVLTPCLCFLLGLCSSYLDRGRRAHDLLAFRR